MENSIELKPRNMKELAAIYKISYKTLKKWLKPHDKTIGKRIGNFYTIPQVKKIYKALGFPGVFNEED